MSDTETPLVPLGDFPVAVDSTMLSAYSSCPQKFFLEFVQKRAPIGKSVHLHAGKAFATASETFRRAFFGESKSKDQAILEAHLAFIREWGDYETPDTEYKNFVNMWTAFEAYIQEYPPETDEFKPFIMSNGLPAVEFRFSIPTNVMHPVTNDPIMFCGRIDMLAVDSNGILYAVDEKTTKALGGSWQRQWNMRGQFYGYVYAARQYGYPCGGALVRGIAIQQTQFGFQEKPVLFSNYQLERWWQNFNFKLSQMVTDWRSAAVAKEMQLSPDFGDEFARSYGEACTSYGLCPYQEVCLHPEPQELYSTYERREWNPLEKDPTAGSEDRQSLMGSLSFDEAMLGL